MTVNDEVVVSLSDERIWRAGTVVPVRRQVFRLLNLFLENPREVLTKERILGSVWPETHVSDASVKASVALLRRLLGDDGATPRFIETVRGRGYRYLGGLRVGEADVSRNVLETAKTGEPTTIAVLPFDNLSGDEEQDYFSDGICDDIITDLSKIEGLVVIARNSSFRYRGRNEDVRQIARALGVRVLLKGSIRRDGDGVRINAQLIDPEARRHIWAERFDGKLVNIFALQDEVTQSVVGALKLQLASDTAAGVAARLPVSVTAHDHFLRGRELLLKPINDAATLQDCEDHLRRAIALDPNYGKPHAALAMAYLLDHQNGWSERSRTALDRAREFAELAVRKAPSDPSAHHAAAVVAGFMGEFGRAEKEIKIALRTRPQPRPFVERPRPRPPVWR